MIGGLHLSPAHTLINLVAAIFALFFGLIATDKGARSFCLAIGGLFMAFGAIGFLAGSAQATTLNAMEPIIDSALWKIFPGQLEFGYRDHILHLVMGGILMAGGLAGERRRATRPAVLREQRKLERTEANRQRAMQRLPH